ncbi:MAG: hypothetical protein IIB38_00410 [Candidatus Hydrogenedentes bacterium]|nr:hypothetical protein [Candidatus Hydrogenedentota bacterium]
MPEKEQTEELTKEQQEQIVHEKAVNEDPAEELTTLLAEKKAEEKSTDVKAEAEDDAKDDSKEEVEAEGAEKEEEKDEFDPEILSIAADLGMSEVRARRFASVGKLTEELTELAAEAERVALVQEKSTKEDPPAAKPEPDKKVDAKKSYIVAGEDLDEALVKQLNAALDGISNQHDERSKALEAHVAALTTQIQANQAAQFVQHFDAMMEKHGEPYSKEIGTGPTYDLSGKVRANREKIVKRMTILVNAHVASNQAIPSDDSLVQSAMKDVFGAKENGNGTVEKRKAPYLRRSSSRGSQTPSTKMRARLDLDEKLAALRGGGEE